MNAESALENVEKAISFIEQNLTEDVTLQDIAEHACLSKYHFSRQFKANTGHKAIDYLRKRRITLAASDLLATEKPIIEIALKYQFDSQAAFTRSFKQVFGQTPNAYRKNGLHLLAFNRDKLSEERLNHLRHNLTLEPQIERLQPRKLTGIQTQTSLSNNAVPQLWKDFVSRKSEIPNALDNGMIGISGYNTNFSPDTFTADSLLEKWATVEVNSVTPPPKGMQNRLLTGGTYAVFTHKGGKKNIVMSFQYMYGVWIQGSIYDIDDRDHFEHYPKNYKGPEHPDSELKIYVPIKLKTKPNAQSAY